MKINKLGNGFMHKTYLIDDGKEKYVAQKLGKAFSSVPDVDYVSNELNKMHFPTIEVLPNWRVTRYIDGEAIKSPNDKQFKSAVALTLRFHAMARDIDVPKRDDVHAVPQLKDWYNEIYKLPKRVIHGDLKPLNFIFRGDTAVALIDLDYVHKAPIVWDIANLICSWCDKEGKGIEYDRIETIKKTYYYSGLCSQEEFDMIDFTVLAFSLEFFYRYQDYDYFKNLEKDYCDMRVKRAMAFHKKYKNVIKMK